MTNHMTDGGKDGDGKSEDTKPEGTKPTIPPGGKDDAAKGDGK